MKLQNVLAFNWFFLNLPDREYAYAPQKGLDEITGADVENKSSRKRDWKNQIEKANRKINGIVILCFGANEVI